MLNHSTGFIAGTGLLLLFATLVGSTGPKVEAPCFSAMVDPAGWTLPVTKEPLQSGPYRQDGYPANVAMTRYGAAEPAWLPHYYVEVGQLIMRSLRCRFENVTRLEVAGRPFAFFAVAKGLDIGVAGDVWWVDRDGDGRFEEFQWITGVRPTIPEWALALSSQPPGR